MNPEHAAATSNAGIVVTPSRLWIWQANDGNAYSEETVPVTIASSSPGLMPARSSAIRLASAAMSASDSPERIV